MNSVVLVGRLTKDVVFKETQSKKKVANGTIAVEEYKGSKGNVTGFFNFQIWEQGAEYLNSKSAKGDLIEIKGSLTNNDYTKDGVKHYAVVVTADSVKILIKNNKNSSVNENEFPVFTDEKLPF